MPRRLLDYDPLSGVATYHTYDHTMRTTTIEEWQDAAPILEANKLQYNWADAAQQRRSGLWHVARIPVGVQYKWLRDEGLNIWDKEALPKVLKKIRDPEWKYLKTSTGRAD